MALPDFFLVGAPKAGTTALHAALARHPELYLSPVKEPKFYLCAERRPPRSEHRGPGDLAPDQRSALLTSFEADIHLLERVTGNGYSDWRRPAGRGSYADRQPTAVQD